MIKATKVQTQAFIVIRMTQVAIYVHGLHKLYVQPVLDINSVYMYIKI